MVISMFNDCLVCLRINYCSKDEYDLTADENGVVTCASCGSQTIRGEFSFPLNYFVSFPRSGNTWTRYFVEILTRKNTHGYYGASSTERGILPWLVPGTSSGVKTPISEETVPILVKRHETEGIERNKQARLLVAVRNFKECIFRDDNTDKNIDARLDKYIDIIDFYDKFNGDKEIIFYEDIISDDRGTIEKVLKFLNRFDENELDEFMLNIESHKKNCMNIYAESKTDGKTARYHQDYVDKHLLKYCDEYLIKNHKHLVDKYLKGYYEI